MSRFPSLSGALRHARETLNRFPLALLSGLGAFAVALVMIDGPERPWHARALATLLLGLPLFTASVTTAERRRIPPRTRWLAELVLVAALAVLYRVSLGWSDQLAALHFAQLLLAAHLLVAVAPYIGPGGRRGFWQYNRFLFLRYLTASFYAVVLFAGLALALGSIDKLLGVKIPSEWYGRLAAGLAFGFHPWFFLSGVPRDYAALEELEDYPQALKVFTQFVLMPLVVVYLTILTVYLGKVIVTRTWPSGWIGFLVSSVSVTGVLALLLVHPIRERADSRWVNVYGRWWFIALLPALVMLLLATAKRIEQYGITEPRYFLLVLAFWMLGIALYFGITGSTDIKRLPQTLCVVALLTALGPWGAYAVSERSQLARFNHILAANGMGRLGATNPPTNPLSFTDRRELSAILRYLHSTRGPDAVVRAVGAPKDSATAWSQWTQRGVDDALAARVLDRMGIAYVSRSQAPVEPGGQFWANVQQPRTLDVAGFEVARGMSYPTLGWIGTPQDSVQLVAAGGVVQVKHGGEVVLTLDVAGAVRAALPEDSLRQRGSGPIANPVIVEAAGQGFRVRWVIDQLGGKVVAGRIELQSANGMLLVGGLAGISKQ